MTSRRIEDLVKLLTLVLLVLAIVLCIAGVTSAQEGYYEVRLSRPHDAGISFSSGKTDTGLVYGLAASSSWAAVSDGSGKAVAWDSAGNVLAVSPNVPSRRGMNTVKAAAGGKLICSPEFGPPYVWDPVAGTVEDLAIGFSDETIIYDSNSSSGVGTDFSQVKKPFVVVDGTTRWLSGLAGKTIDAWAFGVSSSGAVVGFDGRQGILWDADGNPSSLGDDFWAMDVNAQGTVIGKVSRWGSPEQAVVWRQGQKNIIAPMPYTYLRDLNDRGYIAGKTSSTSFLLTPDGTYKWLPWGSNVTAIDETNNLYGSSGNDPTVWVTPEPSSILALAGGIGILIPAITNRRRR